MGFLSGDNIPTIAVGKRVTTNATVTAYDGPDGTAIGTIPAGSVLGICNNTADKSLFMFGSWWLSFPAPDGGLNGITDAFWVPYDASALLVDSKPPKDNSYFNGLPEGLSNVFGSIWNMVFFIIGIAAVIVIVYIIFNRTNK